MKRLSVPQEDNENFYCPGKKSLYWSLVDTNPVHVKMHPVLKQDKYFSDGGKFSWDTRMMCTKRAIKRHGVLPTVCDPGFLPSLWPRLVQQEVPWVYVTSSVVLWWVRSCPLPNFRQGLLLQLVDAAHPQLLVVQHPRWMTSRRKIPSLLESWEKSDGSKRHFWIANMALNKTDTCGHLFIYA